MATVATINQADLWFAISHGVHLLQLITECMTIIGVTWVASGANDKGFFGCGGHAGFNAKLITLMGLAFA